MLFGPATNSCITLILSMSFLFKMRDSIVKAKALRCDCNSDLDCTHGNVCLNCECSSEVPIICNPSDPRCGEGQLCNNLTWTCMATNPNHEARTNLSFSTALPNLNHTIKPNLKAFALSLCEPGPCGPNAECLVTDEGEDCKCPEGYKGDPFSECLPTELICSSPCGAHAKCHQDLNGRPTCLCKEGFIGDPTKEDGCRPGCSASNDCEEGEICLGSRCTRSCQDFCGEQAICVIRNHLPICKCPQGFIGDPFLWCVNQTTVTTITPQTDTTSKRTTSQFTSDLFTSATTHKPFISTTSQLFTSTTSQLFTSTTIKHSTSTTSQPFTSTTSQPFTSTTSQPFTSTTSRPFTSTTSQPFTSAISQLFTSASSQAFTSATNQPFTSSTSQPFTSAISSATSQTLTPSQHPTDMCNPSPCGANSVCGISGDRPVCRCPPQHTGDPFLHCYALSDPCSPSPCGPHSNCRPHRNIPVCCCQPGFFGTPPLCRKAPLVIHPPENPCDPSPCGRNALCQSMPGLPPYRCSCLPGYGGLPPQCSQLIHSELPKRFANRLYKLVVGLKYLDE